MKTYDELRKLAEEELDRAIGGRKATNEYRAGLPSAEEAHWSAAAARWATFLVGLDSAQADHVAAMERGEALYNRHHVNRGDTR